MSLQALLEKRQKYKMMQVCIHNVCPYHELDKYDTYADYDEALETYKELSHEKRFYKMQENTVNTQAQEEEQLIEQAKRLAYNTLDERLGRNEAND